MALVFPPDPSIDDIYLGWRWDGAKWTYVSGVAGVAGVASYNTRTGAVTSVLADVTTVTGTGVTAQARLGLSTVAATGAYADLSGVPAIPAGSSTTPVMDGTAAVGVGTTWARADHVHASDTSRYAASNPSGYQTAAQVTTALAPYAPLASPVFTGDARAATPTYGDNDTSIATTAFVQTAVAPVGNNTGRNLLHNSMFNVQQRGVGPWSATATYTLDRWRLDLSADTIGVQPVALNDALRTAIGDEAAVWALNANTTGNAGAGAFSCVSQHMEGVRKLAGKTVTISFWAYTASGTGKVGVALQQKFGSGGSPSADVLVNGIATPTLTTTPTRYTVTHVMPSVAGKTLGTNGDDNTRLALFFSCGATNSTFAGGIGVQTANFVLWGVQLEIGSVATPLEKRDPADELALCQRFYQTGATQAAFVSSGVTTATTVIPFVVPMRAQPTMTGNWTAQTNATGSYGPAGVYGFQFNQAVSAGAGNGVNVYGIFTASADL